VTAVAELPRPIGDVLGGGERGAIQVGMLQALSAHDSVPDLVAGTSSAPSTAPPSPAAQTGGQGRADARAAGTT
jgi:hypothetical protein